MASVGVHFKAVIHLLLIHCLLLLPFRVCGGIRIYHECEVGIEKSTKLSHEPWNYGARDARAFYIFRSFNEFDIIIFRRQRVRTCP